MTITSRIFASLLASIFAFGATMDVVLADPPSWAPAHGYRAKHGDEPQKAVRALPPGLDGGQCHPDKLSGKTVGLIIGATLGAAIGAGASSEEDRAFGTALGAVIGALIGKKIGQALGPSSKACVGETLEYAADNQTITWHDPDVKIDYALTPTKSFIDSGGKACRDYVIKASDSATSKTADGSACRYGDNAWQIVN